MFFYLLILKKVEVNFQCQLCIDCGRSDRQGFYVKSRGIPANQIFTDFWRESGRFTGLLFNNDVPRNPDVSQVSSN